ncbi:hypothetical protein VVD49_01720 [Uliginosibacterium sp. H3]|uniref:Uncharacterized protein n=1 Tax=Uliginosibacterium silvisoli TaxID=3114758 RepID=A0ABU6JYL8_9RHOO|nr:hypothetical protein [Uliginosibacterium sp. H3]
MPTHTADKPSAAPLAQDDEPEHDGSEDPGVGLELTRNAGVKLPLSPSTAEHVDVRSVRHGGLPVGDGGKTETVGVGEGATVSHVQRPRP